VQEVQKESVVSVEKLGHKAQEVKQDLQVSMERWVFKVSWDLKEKKETQVKEDLKGRGVFKEIVQTLRLLKMK
jgi:hypothetical protein